MGFTEITSEKRKNIQLLSRYQCRTCKKWKDATSFANKETNGYKSKIAMGHKVNGTTAQLRCRVCAGAQLHERQCEGPCHTWKPLEQYSKSSRMAGGSGWCQSCMLWKDACENGIPGAAPPTGDLAPDEDVRPSANHSRGGNDIGYQSDPEAGGDSDDDYPTSTASAWGATWNEPAAATPVQQSAPSSTMARPFAQPSTIVGPSGPSSVASRPSAPSSTVVRPQAPLANASRPSAPTSTVARPSAVTSAVTPATSLGDNITASTAAMSQMSIGSGPWSSQNVRPGAAHPLNNTSILPPHLRARPSGPNPTSFAPRQVSDSRTVSSVSNPYEGSRTEATSQPGWGAVDARRRAPGPAPVPQTYTGWDVNGVAHIQQRFLSSGTPSETGSTVTTTTNSPAMQSPPPPPATARNSNWAKPAGSRNYHRQIQYNPLEHQTNPQCKVVDDSSDDDDDVDNM
ncbi:uncharacterized protein PAC_02873 [Phialocephala subalpina]|uniref:Stc1 domain-containing protein n=1 Tax=Phialocephala subalpina TaxID=576137 RepID=A0A1L7WJP2_9HELO|nr:uncharacterized protein PAC_02873 [Phialocephala subalpina]